MLGELLRWTVEEELRQNSSGMDSYSRKETLSPSVCQPTLCSHVLCSGDGFLLIVAVQCILGQHMEPDFLYAGHA
ncbi:unnamed protein product [Sphagnum troendelagicum]|uniref:Uncharacterized protein n=1 Tax=Sphagnum troendelagicum TaxID=128251 RepID=A0ABP0TG24_9BRYO